MNKKKYLSISSTGDNGTIMRVRHDLGLENIVRMTRMEGESNAASFPVPENNPTIIGTRDQNVTICIEAHSVDTTSVLLQIPQ